MEKSNPPVTLTTDLEAAPNTNVQENGTAGNQSGDPADVDYSIFTISQRRFIVFMASWAGFFSPVSSQIYFPALITLGQDLHVSNSLMNLTLTSYMVSVKATSILQLDWRVPLMSWKC
jgi:hypothetical protein